MKNMITGKKIKNYPQKDFSHPVTAVDVVLFSIIENRLSTLLLKLSEKPFPNKWALPGGLVTKSEDLEQAAARHLKDKAGVTSVHMEQLYTFGNPDRDPVGWVVSVAYIALINNEKISPKASERYNDISWFPVSELPELAYDHKEIIKMATKRLQSKLAYTNIVNSLLPREFTLSQLQNVYEVILGKKLDKRNFRKKIIATKLVKSANKKSVGAHRPAELYVFSKKTLQEVEIL